MEYLKIGSLNVNGLRDRKKQALVSEYFNIKNIAVGFLQETHSNASNESEWGLWWKGEYVLSHGSNVSAGVAILFNPTLKIKIVSTYDIEPGRLLLVRVEIQNFLFLFVNIYAPNGGTERVLLFEKLGRVLKTLSLGDIIIMAGDWNCTLNFNIDRNAEEPHQKSACVLSNMVKILNLEDIWRMKNPLLKQYTWVKVTDGRVHAARLDRFYISRDSRNRVGNVNIIPNIISDHKMITMDFVMLKESKRSLYWYFNNKLLQDNVFCENFKLFWEIWRKQKGNYGDIKQWWDIGKVQIRVFCQQYSSYSKRTLKIRIQDLENEISDIEEKMMARNGLQLETALSEKKLQLNNLLYDKVKAALVRARFIQKRDIDGPTKYFFNLERKNNQGKLMVGLKKDDGVVTYDSYEMRRIAVDFYSDLYADNVTDSNCRDELFSCLKKLTPEQQEVIDLPVTFQEVSKAVHDLSSEKAPGLDGFPSEFYKHFWNVIGKDYFEMLLSSIQTGSLPKSCNRAVLSLLPKKGDLYCLKNWRPVALMCIDYKIFSKCIANRLNNYMSVLIMKEQSYCVKGRCIKDNLFLMRDVIDYAMCKDYDLGLISLDQEKAFDRVEHAYLFDLLKAYGFGNGFISWVNLLYNEAECMVKIDGGLSVPIKVKRGIRQGCPLSGQLYSLVIEPLLCKLREQLTGLHIEGSNILNNVKLSAYADDITVIIRNSEDIKIVLENLKCYGRASSAKINWTKSEALWCGSERSNVPQLPNNVTWRKDGFKFLGVFLGSKVYKEKNWEGLLEKVRLRLSNWKWLIPQLSYRGRVLIVNNLVASTLWHKMAVLDPPAAVIKDIQKCLVDFFWTGQHWLRPAVLYLPLNEGGQGLIDIGCRIAAFRLQAAQRLLYGKDVSWAHVACGLLRRGGQLGLDRQLFLINLNDTVLVEITPFYKSVLKSWNALKVVREEGIVRGSWIKEEPLLYNPALPINILNSHSMQAAMVKAQFIKVSHLWTKSEWMSSKDMAAKLGIKSLRFAERLRTEFLSVIPSTFTELLKDEETKPQYINEMVEFPNLGVSAAVETRAGDEGKLLSFKTPELNLFADIGKRALYYTCVKVMHYESLKDVLDSKWQGIDGLDGSPKGSWRTLYKRPIDKRTGDLQWRIIHGIIATNRHRAHIDPTVRDECPFCFEHEDMYHLFLQCERLKPMFLLLEDWSKNLNFEFTLNGFIYGPKYKYQNRKTDVLINFLYGQAKLAIWLTRKERMNGGVSTDVNMTLKGLLSARLTVEFTYYKMVGDLDVFKHTWALNAVLCDLEDGNLHMNV